MRSCEEFEELISEFLDGVLSKDEQIELMKHMSGCPVCQKYFDDLVAMHEALEEVESAPVPEDLAARVLSAVHETRQDAPVKPASVFRWKRWAALAACCAVALGGLWVFQSKRGDSASLQAAVTANMPPAAAQDIPAAAENDEGVDALSDSPDPAAEAGSYRFADGDAAGAELPEKASLPEEFAAEPEAPPTEDASGGKPAAPVPADSRTAPPSYEKRDDSAGLISAEDAKAAALTHAGLTAGEVTFTQTKLEWENGKQVYDVEFVSPSGEYDYDIDAVTGNVVAFDHDAESYTAPAAGTAVTREKAEEIALAQVPGASASHITKLELDDDDGAAVYEVEIVFGAMEYDLEISASTGEILEFEGEPVH